MCALQPIWSTQTVCSFCPWSISLIYQAFFWSITEGVLDLSLTTLLYTKNTNIYTLRVYIHIHIHIIQLLRIEAKAIEQQPNKFQRGDTVGLYTDTPQRRATMEQKYLSYFWTFSSCFLSLFHLFLLPTSILTANWYVLIACSYIVLHSYPTPIPPLNPLPPYRCQ